MLNINETPTLTDLYQIQADINRAWTQEITKAQSN